MHWPLARPIAPGQGAAKQCRHVRLGAVVPSRLQQVLVGGCKKHLPTAGRLDIGNNFVLLTAFGVFLWCVLVWANGCEYVR